LSGFFLFRRELVAGVNLRPIGWKISLEVLVRTGTQRIAEVPYTFARREDGDSKATVGQGLMVLRHILVLALSMGGLIRFATFAAVGASGVAVNMGILLTFDMLGFDALTWPVWVASESAILWNYTWNRRLTWSERASGHWWTYNLAALSTSAFAVLITRLLVQVQSLPLWLGSLGGILAGMAINYALLDRFVFARLPWRLLTPSRALALLGTFPR
jgi:dolichol-phosphate mannosyltransferase